MGSCSVNYIKRIPELERNVNNRIEEEMAEFCKEAVLWCPAFQIKEPKPTKEIITRHLPALCCFYKVVPSTTECQYMKYCGAPSCYCTSCKYSLYLAEIKTTPLKESSVEHAALCVVWRAHMDGGVAHTSQHIGYHHMRCARCFSVRQHSKHHDRRQHTVGGMPQRKKLNFVGCQCFVGRDRGQNKVVRAATFTQLWAHATHITWTLHW